MAVLTMPARQSTSHQIQSGNLRELCRFLSSFPNIVMSEQECAALAVAALSGHPEAEFMVGSVFDAANEPARATEWYQRSAAHDYLPAMLQLVALR
jgi:TPR repeat protein